MGLLLACLVSPARATPGQGSEPTQSAGREARKWYEKGEAAFEAGQYEQALEDFRLAYQAKPLSRLLLLMGQTNLELRRPEETIRQCRRFLAEPELTPTERQKAEQFIREAEDMLPPRPPPLVKKVEPRRPTWRIVTGSLLLGLGGAAAGYGGVALDINDKDIGGTHYSGLEPGGIAFVSVGGVLLVGGAILVGIPAGGAK